MEKYKSFISLDWELILQLINTGILYLFLKKFLFGRIASFLEERKANIEKSFKEADDAAKRAEEIKAEYADKISVAQDEAREIVKEASKRAEERAEEIVKNAKEEAAKVMERASLEVQRERQNVLNELKNEISNMAILAASKVIEKDIDKKQHELLIENFIKEVGEAKWQN